jgi:thioredoxin reductase (NADPH)
MKQLDMVIIGSGPAGMAAAIYAVRAQMNFIILERNFAGGQVLNTYEVENYPGIKTTSGFELSNMFREHAESLGVDITYEEVTDIEASDTLKKVTTTNEVYETKTLLLATGAQWKKIGVEGEAKFSGLGVSYCATCDGAFYRNKETVVVGGGDVAVEDAIYLSRICKKVYLIHRRDELRAVKILQEKLFAINNIEILWDTEIQSIEGNESVERVKLLNNKTGEKRDLEVSGAFIGVGTTPNSSLLLGKVEDEKGWIITDEDCETSVKGVFAIGDVRKKSLRQIITSAADGAIAVYAAEKYI